MFIREDSHANLKSGEGGTQMVSIQLNHAVMFSGIGMAVLLLAACTGAAPVSEPAGDFSVEEPVESTSETLPAEEQAESPGTAEPAGEAPVIPGSDEPLPAWVLLTGADWKTDWSRHTIPYDEIISGGVPRDGIRSIDAPEFLSYGEASEWLADTEPIMAVEIEGDARAYPLSILTRHEIVNDVVGGIPVAVTFCPLCNSGLVFDRRVEGEVYEFGVSGLLRNSDLIMYDRTTESLWQQFTGEGIVGEHAGDRLDFIPSSIVSYADFREAYPEGVVLSNMGRSYGWNPYEFYDQGTGRPFLFYGELDNRLPLMLRVVGLNMGGESKAYPYDVLSEERVINDTVGGQDVAIFFKFGTNSALGAPIIAEAEDVGAATVFDPHLNGQKLTFRFDGEAFVDEETGSVWNLLGQATSGDLAGERLTPLVHSDHFWFSWAAFYPDTKIYGGE